MNDCDGWQLTDCDGCTVATCPLWQLGRRIGPEPAPVEVPAWLIDLVRRES